MSEKELIPPKEDFYNELKELLRDNAKWVEQVKMSLAVLAHLYDSFLKIENKYNTSLKECAKIASQIREEYLKIEALSVKIGEDILEFSREAKGLLENMSLKESAVLEALEKCEHLAHEIEVYFSEIENFRIKLELFKEEMAEFNEAFNAQKSEVYKAIEDFKEEFARDKARLEKMISDANADFTGFRTEIALAKKELLSKKEEAKLELENLAKRQFGALYAHVFDLERVLMKKGVVSLEEKPLHSTKEA